MKAYEQIAKDINEAMDSAWEAGHRAAFEEVGTMYGLLNDKQFLCWIECKLMHLERERRKNGNK